MSADEFMDVRHFWNPSNQLKTLNTNHIYQLQLQNSLLLYGSNKKTQYNN